MLELADGIDALEEVQFRGAEQLQVRSHHGGSGQIKGVIGEGGGGQT